MCAGLPSEAIIQGLSQLHRVHVLIALSFWVFLTAASSNFLHIWPFLTDCCDLAVMSDECSPTAVVPHVSGVYSKNGVQPNPFQRFMSR